MFIRIPLCSLQNLFLILLLPIQTLTKPRKIDLGSSPTPHQNQWNFYSAQRNISGIAAQVPGDIYADLQANGFIEEPLYGQGDRRYRWVGREDWTYERSIELAAEVKNSTFVLLQLNGLDGPAAVWLNDHHLINVDNQFHYWALDIKPFILFGLNVLRISFPSPVNMAKIKSDVYQVFNLHALPPECPPPVYNGECHVNHLRKMQASFSWDWGPSFPTVGIWRPILLEYFDGISIQQFSPMVQPTISGNFLLNVSLQLHCSPSIKLINVQLNFPELALSKLFIVQPGINGCPQLKLTNLTLLVPRQKVQLWWPRGYGQQKLYQLELTVSFNGNILDSANKRVAFRTIFLNQSEINALDPSKGTLFQFEVNGMPIFLKGTNWVPISSFPARDHSLRRQFLFHSMAEANMNALRVWGGGFYEEEAFYDMADEQGFLIWQDFMFACALYPTDLKFLHSVQREVEEQVLRLRHHPSILCWAGNNENELAVRTQWYPEWNYPEEAQARDYLKLYKATMEPLVRSLDPSRPFLLSSPSNGKETEKEGGIAQNPGDPKFGDVHFYAETANLWNDTTFPIPRCSSEFGVQSMPFRGTMLRWIPPEDWHYMSETLVRRQHHPGGILTLPALIFQHFPIPFSWANATENSSKNASLNNGLSSSPSLLSSSVIDQFVFLSQVHQGIALQAQIEHYRRWRSQLDQSGQGRTMCALYWQLNDVWAAPTWSSVDFDLRWKMAHHFVRRAFAPLLISMYIDSSKSLRLFVVSDLTTPIRNASIHLEMFVLQLGLDPIFEQTWELPEIPALSSIETQIPTEVLERKQRLRQLDYSEDNYVITSKLLDASQEKLLTTSPSPRAVLLPDKFHKTGRYGKARLIAFKGLKNQNSVYELILSADNVLPLVWVDLNDNFKLNHPEVLYHFDENAFAMTTRKAKVKLILFSNPEETEIQQQDIQIMSL